MAPTTAMPEAIAGAQSVASRNFSANLRALAESQPELIAAVRHPEAEWAWTFGRDGSLTALAPDGQWLADCSLPYRAACAMLKSIESRGAVACLLAPVHAAQVRRTIELLSHQQALIVLAPDAEFLPVAFHCHDFAPAIEAGRLFFAVGSDWAGQLGDLFRQYPGLPTPTLFLRPPTTPDAVSQPLIETSQRVFTEAGAARSKALAELAARPAVGRSGKTPPGRVCVVAPAVYSLWSDAGSVLADVLSPALDVRRLDPERPTTSSHLALASMVRECDALATANFARANLPAGVVPDETPWITWVTTSHVPDGGGAGVHDRLLVADPAFLPAAIAAGWDRDRVAVATWPVADLPRPAAASAGLGMIADTRPLRTDVDEDTFEFSSHMVLWELIASELHETPLLAADDPDAYLTSRMGRLSIGPEGFDRATFLNSLVIPAYQQGLARALLAARLPLRLFGRGWGELPEFAPHAAGPITSRSGLLRAAASAVALVRATPGGDEPHPTAALGRPVVRPASGPPNALIRAARTALAAKSVVQRPTGPSLTPELVLTLLCRSAAA